MKIGDRLRLKPVSQCNLANEVGIEYSLWFKYHNNIVVRVSRLVTDQQKTNYLKKYGDYPVNIQIPDKKNPNLFVGGSWVPSKWLIKKPSAKNKPFIEDKV